MIAGVTSVNNTTASSLSDTELPSSSTPVTLAVLLCEPPACPLSVAVMVQLVDAPGASTSPSRSKQLVPSMPVVVSTGKKLPNTLSDRLVIVSGSELTLWLVIVSVYVTAPPVSGTCRGVTSLTIMIAGCTLTTGVSASFWAGGAGVPSSSSPVTVTTSW